MKSAVIFDLDGTFYESKALDTENRKAAVLAIAKCKGLPLRESELLLSFNQGVGNEKNSIAKTLQNIGVADEVFKFFQIEQLKPEAHLRADIEVVKLVRSLYSKYKLVMLTNTRREIALRIIKILGFIEEDFNLIVAGGDGFPAKPSEETLKRIFEIVKCNPVISFTVGDRWKVDHEPAVNLGVTAVQVSGRADLINWMEKIR